MLRRIFVCIVLSLALDRLVDSKCHEPLSINGTLRFDKHMRKDEVANLYETKRVDCCINGAWSIIWLFSTDKTQWSAISLADERYEFISNNRTIYFIKISTSDEGYYKCIGTDTSGRTLSNITRVIVGPQKLVRQIEIIDFSDTSRRSFKIGSDITLFCLSKMKYDTKPYFLWRKGTRSMVKSQLTARNNVRTLIDGSSGFSNVTKLLSDDELSYEYNFTITIFGIKMSHGGLYCCEVGDLNVKEWVEYKRILINIDPVRQNELVAELIGILICFLGLLIALYMFYYDIKWLTKCFLKATFFKNRSFGKYNFIFVYDFQHPDQFKIVQKVINKIETRGFSCFFYHRDQAYGKDILEDLNERIRESNVVVAFALTPIWRNPTCDFCMQMAINDYECKHKIIYVIEDKKKLLVDCLDKTMLADLTSKFTSKVFKLTSMKSVCDSKNTVWHHWSCHRFLIWLMSSLPLNYTFSESYIKRSYINGSYL